MEGGLGAYETKLLEYSETLTFSLHVNQQMESCVSHRGNADREHLQGEVSAESVVDIDLAEETCQI